MPNGTFLDLCKDIVVKYFNEHHDKTDAKGTEITKDDTRNSLHINAVFLSSVWRRLVWRLLE